MAIVELGSLSAHLDEDEVAALRKALKAHDVEVVDGDHDTVVVARNLDDDIVSDFLDRLDAHEASADIYLPLEFDGVVKTGTYKVGSAPMLVTVLEEMKEELLADDEDEDDDADDDEDEAEEEDEEDEYEASGSLRAKDDQLRALWRLLYKAAGEAATSGTILFIRR